MRTENEIISEAVSLPINIRTKLVEKLLQSINPSEKEIDKLWAKESERRIKELESNKTKTIPEKKVFLKIHKRLKV